LEVGTGFHPELTGRENVYLNGTILGMTKKEVDAKFDEIVEFSGVEKFLDTPVKRYSSGMSVRLAFSVAAHLEPEVLLVDEVLAVGDADFQKKCLAKMQDVGQTGRTVLFVSHNMPAITRLCERVILLDEGRIIADGTSYQIVADYLKSGYGTSAIREWYELEKAPGNDTVRLCAVRVKNYEGQIAETIDIRTPFTVEAEYEVLKPGCVLTPSFSFFTENGVLAFPSLDSDPTWRGRSRPEGRYISTVTVPGNLLAEGTLLVESRINTLNPPIEHVYEPDIVTLHIVDSHDGDSARGEYVKSLPGVVRPLLDWTTRFRERETDSASFRLENLSR
jgi:lipopolysaccharide transport system ATP-binding protein